MKGIIINLFEQFVVEKYGDAMLEDIYENSKLPEDVPPFVGPVSYPDKDLAAMLQYLSGKNGDSPESLLKSLGAFSIPILAMKYPQFFSSAPSAREFLKSLNDLHYVELAKLYSDFSPPVILLSDDDESKTILSYKSKRNLCPLMEGLLEGVAEYYHENIRYTKTACIKNGADNCLYELTISRG